ncbi:MAG: hypothetical protein K0V04_04340 [Deltaproteobacteria bacterium]|nr:hypothetical protein [Deltaproteobacteria bacterium]
MLAPPADGLQRLQREVDGRAHRHRRRVRTRRVALAALAMAMVAAVFVDVRRAHVSPRTSTTPTITRVALPKGDHPLLAVLDGTAPTEAAVSRDGGRLTHIPTGQSNVVLYHHQPAPSSTPPPG